jgi:tRNA C32,U32 (ribose-2'-O)-methylase TrmJ
MKNMKYKIDEKDAEQKIYDDLFDHVMHMLNEHSMPVDMVASTLMAIGQRLYRTHLTDRSYHALMEIIRDTDVEPYNVKKERLH